MFSSNKKNKFQNPGLLSINGYVHVQWMYDFQESVFPRSGFILRRGRVEFRYELADIVATEIEIGCDKLALTVKDAYIEYQVSPILRFIAGLHKMPFSQEELTPISKLLMIERSETNEMFEDYKYLSRDIGLTIEGELFRNKLPVGYRFGVFNGNGNRIFQDNNNAKQFTERLTIKPLNWFTLGINTTQRNDSLTGKLVTAWGEDILCRFGSITVKHEILLGNAGPYHRMLGGYLLGAYRIGDFEPGLRIERLYTDLTETKEYTTLLTTACNWYPHRKVQLKTNLITDIKTGWKFENKILIQAQAGF
jgi:hypothetical protein